MELKKEDANACVRRRKRKCLTQIFTAHFSEFFTRGNWTIVLKYKWNSVRTLVHGYKTAFIEMLNINVFLRVNHRNLQSLATEMLKVKMVRFMLVIKEVFLFESPTFNFRPHANITQGKTSISQTQFCSMHYYRNMRTRNKCQLM